MASTNLLALIDDIATLLDDVAVMTKIATKKSSGVLGDDLALNAQQVVGMTPDREIPVILKVAKGSLLNKVILVPIALILSFVAPILIKVLLVIGGLYLCYEGFEKVWEKLRKKKEPQLHIEDSILNPEEFEKERVKGAIKTDFILSAEIIVIVLGIVSSKSIILQALVLSLMSLMMTLGVYGLVALLVKLDDIGLYLLKKNSKSKLGNLLIVGTPKLMRLLGVVGTIAMFLVGGGILSHILYEYTHLAIFHNNHQMLFDGLVGLSAGGLLVLLHSIFELIKQKTPN